MPKPPKADINNPFDWCRVALNLPTIQDRADAAGVSLRHEDPHGNRYRWDTPFTPDQQDAWRSIFTAKHTHLRSGNGYGKTWWLACLALWWGHLYHDCLIVTTASVQRQVEKTLWGHMRKLYRAASWPMRGEIAESAPEWKIGGNTVAIGFTTSTSKGTSQDTADQFGGHHHERLLMILDEASGISRAIISAALGCMQADGARLVIAGNPLARQGEFFNIWQREKAQ